MSFLKHNFQCMRFDYYYMKLDITAKPFFNGVPSTVSVKVIIFHLFFNSLCSSNLNIFLIIISMCFNNNGPFVCKAGAYYTNSNEWKLNLKDKVGVQDFHLLTNLSRLKNMYCNFIYWNIRHKKNTEDELALYITSFICHFWSFWLHCSDPFDGEKYFLFCEQLHTVDEVTFHYPSSSSLGR